MSDNNTQPAAVRGLRPGEQEQWWCPSCGRVLHKAPYVQGGQRFHSSRCQKPMQRATVTLTVQAVPS